MSALCQKQTLIDDLRRTLVFYSPVSTLARLLIDLGRHNLSRQMFHIDCRFQSGHVYSWYSPQSALPSLSRAGDRIVLQQKERKPQSRYRKTFCVQTWRALELRPCRLWKYMPPRVWHLLHTH